MAGRSHPKEVGKRLRERRLALGLSQRSIAGPEVSAAHISRIEAGTRVASATALRTIASALGVSANWLETGNDDEAEQLAKLVLKHSGRPLPRIAQQLARSVLNNEIAR
jgi:transcriptional regulator with XRE-family HTH domain